MIGWWLIQSDSFVNSVVWSIIILAMFLMGLGAWKMAELIWWGVKCFLV